MLILFGCYFTQTYEKQCRPKKNSVPSVSSRVWAAMPELPEKKRMRNGIMYRKVMGVLVFLRCFMLKYLSCLRGENISETGAKGSRQEAFLTAHHCGSAPFRPCSAPPACCRGGRLLCILLFRPGGWLLPVRCPRRRSGIL